mmetsp:Transcript_6974/g.10443  ORF Transcript_6974/g.10443 Transcript_6974/m.10443 type:complete len:252 (-) Transcript_6974:583-1338(-)
MNHFNGAERSLQATNSPTLSPTMSPTDDSLSTLAPTPAPTIIDVELETIVTSTIEDTILNSRVEDAELDFIKYSADVLSISERRLRNVIESSGNVTTEYGIIGLDNEEEVRSLTEYLIEVSDDGRLLDAIVANVKVANFEKNMTISRIVTRLKGVEEFKISVSTNLPIGIIVGITLGGFFLILILFMSINYCFKKKELANSAVLNDRTRQSVQRTLPEGNSSNNRGSMQTAQLDSEVFIMHLQNNFRYSVL